MKDIVLTALGKTIIALLGLSVFSYGFYVLGQPWVSTSTFETLLGFADITIGISLVTTTLTHKK